MNEQVDPVCGKPVVVGERTPSAECGREAAYFCSQACREKFVCDPGKKLSDYRYDLVIVGGGPAGIAAGIYAALADLDTLLVTKSLGGQAWDSTKVVNYPGFEEIEGPDLVDRFQRHLFENLRLAHHIGEAVDLDKTKNTFSVDNEGGQTFRARALIIATGMRRRRLGIPGEARFLGKGVLEFHALLAERFSDRDVAVVGGGNSAVQAGLSLARAGARVRLVARGYRPDSYRSQENVFGVPDGLHTPWHEVVRPGKHPCCRGSGFRCRSALLGANFGRRPMPGWVFVQTHSPTGAGSYHPKIFFRKAIDSLKTHHPDK